MAQGTGFQGTYKITPKSPQDLKRGAWYYWLTCLVCSTPIAILDDKSNGAAPAKFTGDGHFRVACPHCGADRLYPVESAEVRAA